MFTNRIFKSEDELPEMVKSATHLFHSNDEVERHNLQRMTSLANVIPPPCKRICSSMDKITGVKGRPERVREQTQQILENLATFKVTQTQGLASVLTLQVGIRYMITININVEDGIFNGASGILKGLIEINGQCSIAWIKFDDEKIGK